MMEMNRLTLPSPPREAKSSGANRDRANIVFSVQLTTSRIGNLTRLNLPLAICDVHTYKHTKYEYILCTSLSVALLSWSVSSTNECPRKNKNAPGKLEIQ